MASDLNPALETSTRLFHELLYPRSVAYLNRISQEIASGTLISMQDRLFIATVAHAIPDDGSELWVFGLGRSLYPTDPAEKYPGLLRSGKSDDGKYDVGYLELDAARSLPDLRLQSWTLDRIGVLGCGREGHPILLVGNPVALGKFTPETDQAPEHWQIANIFYLTKPLMHPDWPTAIAEPGDPNVDVFLEYPEGDAKDMLTGKAMPLPHPGGMSGGGIWDQGFFKGEMWSPDAARLFAIQAGWYARSRFVRGIQIIHWLRLIHRDYPDLRSLLESRFDALR